MGYKMYVLHTSVFVSVRTGYWVLEMFWDIVGGLIRLLRERIISFCNFVCSLSYV